MRTTYVLRNGKLVEKPPVEPAARVHVVGDIEPCRNMIEGGMITTRREIREIERRHRVVQCGNDWSGVLPRPPGLPD